MTAVAVGVNVATGVPADGLAGAIAPTARRIVTPASPVDGECVQRRVTVVAVRSCTVNAPTGSGASRYPNRSAARTPERPYGVPTRMSTGPTECGGAVARTSEL